MIILNATTKSLQFKLAGSITTNQLPFSASYVDATTSSTTPGEQDGASNSTTAVDLVSSPGASTQRLIKSITIQNADTASATVTIIYNNNSTLRNVIKVTLAVGDQLIYEDGQGWSCLDANGNLKTSGSGTASSANTYQSSPASPTGTTSGSPVMLGLAGAITPNYSGKICVIINGYMTQTGTGGAFAQIYYGTGTAPTNGAAATGTSVGTSATWLFSSNGACAPYTAAAIISGLTLGTPIWIDLGFGRAAANGTASMGNVSITAFEIK